jgi:hypothetical protein
MPPKAVETGGIICRIGADEFAPDLRLQEIGRRFWYVFQPNVFGVVTVKNRICRHRHPRAVPVFGAGADLVESLRLEMQQQSARVPGDKILNALQDHQIGLDLLRPDLLFDLGVEEVTQAAHE